MKSVWPLWDLLKGELVESYISLEVGLPLWWFSEARLYFLHWCSQRIHAASNWHFQILTNYSLVEAQPFH